MKAEIIKRLESPIFILALASVVYQILIKLGIIVDQTLYQNIIDIVTYALIGSGIYKSFGDKPQEPMV
jgi:hypothetical protein